MNIFNMISNCREMALHVGMFIRTFINSFIHSFCSLSYGRIHWPFKSKFSTECNLVLSTSVSSSLSFPNVHQAAATFLTSCHFFSSLYFSFNNMFEKVVPTQDVTNSVSHPSIHCMYNIPLLLDYALLLCFSHDQSNWSSPSFYSTTLRNLPGILDLLSKLSKFQHHT